MIMRKRDCEKTRLIFDGFVYHSSAIKSDPPIRYVLCAYNRKFGCPGRAHLPLHGDKDDIKITREHNHPPDFDIEECDSFLMQLKTAAQRLPGTLKEIHSTISELNPRGSQYYPFKRISSSMRRWRRQAT